MRRLQAADLPHFFALLAREPFLGGRIRTAWQCYHRHPAACGFYLADGTGALMVLGAGALLCGAADIDELGAFLSFSGVAGFKGETVIPAGYTSTPRLLMTYTGQPTQKANAPQADGLTLDTRPNLWALAHAGLLQGIDPGAWYADSCARRNRGLAHILAFRAGDATVATAGVYSLQPQSAYITAVATHPAFRGRGLAGALVGRLAAQYAPRPVQLICAPALRGFYENLGFAVLRVIQECNRKEGGV